MGILSPSSSEGVLRMRQIDIERTLRKTEEPISVSMLHEKRVRRFAVIGHRIAACCVIQFLVVAAVHAQNKVSPPVGVLRIPISTNQSQVLVSSPFAPLDPSIESAIGDQLTPGTTPESSDSVLQWDPSLPEYIAAYRADPAAYTEAVSNWVSNFQTLNPSEMEVFPGDGFWLVSRHAQDQNVFLAGQVVLSETHNMIVLPSLNLIAYPFSTSIGLENTDLWQSWQQDPSTSGDTLVDQSGDPDQLPRQLTIGQGYWYDRQADTPLIWLETRPYPNPFPTDGAPPSVSSIAVINSGGGVRLSIVCSGTQGETLDIFYQDISPATSFDPSLGWLVANENLPANEQQLIAWEDYGSPQRASIGEIAGRYYLIGRADIDSDGDGTPDAREQFVYGTDPLSGTSVPGAIASGEDNIQSGGARQAEEGAGRTDNIAFPPDMALARIIFVDKERGSDHLTGRSSILVDSAEGPKKTVRSGIQEAQDGDTIVIKGGWYKEDIDLSGKDVRLVLDGDLDITRLGKRHADKETRSPDRTPPEETSR